jgi:hypothetical protein
VHLYGASAIRHATLAGSKGASRVRIVLIIAALLLVATPVTAQSLCAEPPMPPSAGSTAATPDQMRTAMADARSYIALSGVYQECMLKEVEAAKTQATAAGQPFEPMIETSARFKAEASKKAQEKVSTAANAALTAYKNRP